MIEREPVPLSVTFDDGHAIQYEKYYPILEYFGLPATFYIVTKWVGEVGFMGWDEILDLWKSDHEIGSHTHTHPKLSKLANEELEFELGMSKNLLKRFGCATLAYPLGDYSDNVVTHARKHYLGARTYLYTLKEKSSQCKYDFERQRYELRAFPIDSAFERQRYELMVFPIEHSVRPESSSLISLPTPTFKSAIAEIVNKGIEQRAWTIFVFHGSRSFGFRYAAGKLCRQPLLAIRNLKDLGKSMKSSQIGDEISKFRWMCEFLAGNEKIEAITVARAVQRFDVSSKTLTSSNCPSDY